MTKSESEHDKNDEKLRLYCPHSCGFNMEFFLMVFVKNISFKFASRWVRNLGCILFLTFLCIVAIEVSLKLFIKSSPRSVNYKFYSNLLGDLPPNVDVVDNLIKNLPYHISTDREGFRITPNIKSNKEDGKTIKILCLGDSFTYGVGVDNEASFPYQLTVFLKNKYPGVDFQVINAGIPFFDIVDELDYWQEKGIKLRPDIVVCQFFNNDVQTMNGSSFRRTRRFPHTEYHYLNSLIETSMIANLAAAFAYKMNIHAIPNAESVDHNDNWYDSKYCNNLSDRQVEIVNTTSKLLDKQFLEDINCRWKYYFKNLSELRDSVVKTGAKFVFINIPDRVQLFNDLTSPSTYLNQRCDYACINFIDFLTLFRTVFHAHKAELYNYPYDFHLNKIGNTLVAHELSEIILVDKENNLATVNSYNNYNFKDLKQTIIEYNGKELVRHGNEDPLKVSVFNKEVRFQGQDSDRDHVEATVYGEVPGELSFDIELSKVGHYFELDMHPIVWDCTNNGELKGFVSFDNGKELSIIDRHCNDPRSETYIFQHYSPANGFSKIKIIFLIGKSTGIIFNKANFMSKKFFIIAHD